MAKSLLVERKRLQKIAGILNESLNESSIDTSKFSKPGEDNAAKRAGNSNLMDVIELRMMEVWMSDELAKVLPEGYSDADLQDAIAAYIKHFDIPQKSADHWMSLGKPGQFIANLKKEIDKDHEWEKKYGDGQTTGKGFNYSSTSHYGGSSW